MKLTLNISHDFTDIDDAAAFVAVAKEHFARWFEKTDAIEAPVPRREVPMERPPVLTVGESAEYAPPSDAPAPAKRGRKPRALSAPVESESTDDRHIDHSVADSVVADPIQPAAPAVLSDPIPLPSAPVATPVEAATPKTAKLPISNPDFQAVNDALVALIEVDGGHGAAMTVFQKHNAKRLSEVPAEKYIALRDDLIAARRKLSASDLL